ncbi:uncharacterized protein LOC112082889 isoform X1 [Eutrema salsugineum]|uniref:uncharacterized protein LOC112082889 isoform X1 n=1 Tax=Eutrema salsugineum TaxID=72664 RepID=UPI000CED192F|nr:uncharacterized protein LOC112082889 isoform X1 [Eutrema salsugineum]
MEREASQLSVSYKERFQKSNMRRMKGCKRAKCCCIVLDELLLWETQLKKKKSQIGNKMLSLPGVTRKREEAYAQSRKVKHNMWSNSQEEVVELMSFKFPRVILLEYPRKLHIILGFKENTYCREGCWNLILLNLLVGQKGLNCIWPYVGKVRIAGNWAVREQVTEELDTTRKGMMIEMFKNFCSFLMHNSENQSREFASRMFHVKHSDVGAVSKNVELTLKNYKGIVDFLPRELGSAGVTMKTPWLETSGNMEVNWKRQEMKFQVNGVPISIHGNPEQLRDRRSKFMDSSKEKMNDHPVTFVALKRLTSD